MLGIDKREPARRSISQGGEKKGPVDRSKGLLGGAPLSGGNSPESFQTGVARCSQGRAMGEERESAVQSHSEEGRGGVEGETSAQKRDGGPEGGFAGVGAKERHLAFSRVQMKLPLKGPGLESLEGSLESGGCCETRRRRRPDSKIVRIKRKADVRREDEERSLMNRLKRTGLSTDPCGTPRRIRKESLVVPRRVTRARRSARKD